MGVWAGTMRRLGHTKGFALVMRRVLPATDKVFHKVTRGRINFGSSVAPTFFLNHTGAKSGKSYKTPLAFVRDGENFALAASNWGQDHNPAWSYNLIAHPDVSVDVDGTTIPVRARVVSAEEKARLWPSFLAFWPAYNTYVKRAGTRTINVFLLERR